MGQEVECTMRWKEQEVAGKALLETDHVLFRSGAGLRTARAGQRPAPLKVLFKEIRKVSAAGGVLRLDFDGGPAEFALGKAAEKWAEKILHPPSRADKLGLKSGATVQVAGEFDAGFLRELEERRVKQARGKTDLVFLAAESANDLARVAKLVQRMHDDGALWVVYPKGVKTIREIDVLEAGRAAGLKDVKVASFSGTQTALKFVIPLARRGGKGVDG
jgi:hypothetical protein